MNTTPDARAGRTSIHGLAWDAWHYRTSTYIPDWYVIASLAVDLSVGAYVAARIPAFQRASRCLGNKL
jgi:hypothetical protein